MIMLSCQGEQHRVVVADGEIRLLDHRLLDEVAMVVMGATACPCVQFGMRLELRLLPIGGGPCWLDRLEIDAFDRAYAGDYPEVDRLIEGMERTTTNRGARLVD